MFSLKFKIIVCNVVTTFSSSADRCVSFERCWPSMFHDIIEIPSATWFLYKIFSMLLSFLRPFQVIFVPKAG